MDIYFLPKMHNVPYEAKILEFVSYFENIQIHSEFCLHQELVSEFFTTVLTVF